jgi:hypothetical protein
MPFGIIVYDEARRIVAIDQAGALVFRTPARELIGRTITDFVPRPDRGQMDEARATFERLGEASGRYALERADGSRESVAYSVLANAPLSGLSLMALALSEAEVASDAVRIRRIGQDVHAGLEARDEELWLGTGSPRLRSAPAPGGEGDAPTGLVVAVFPTQPVAWSALLAMQAQIEARIEIGLNSFDGGQPRDARTVLAVRAAERSLAGAAAIVAEFGGALLSGQLAP